MVESPAGQKLVKSIIFSKVSQFIKNTKKNSFEWKNPNRKTINILHRNDFLLQYVKLIIHGYIRFCNLLFKEDELISKEVISKGKKSMRTISERELNFKAFIIIVLIKSCLSYNEQAIKWMKAFITVNIESQS